MANRPAGALATGFATWFGCGFSPLAPGTIGSAGALAIAYVLHAKLGFSAVQMMIPAVLLIWPGVWAAEKVAEAMSQEDPGLVVIDEVIGQWITLAGAQQLNWKSWLGAFLLFRILDVWKPAPVRSLERLPGGIGIIADDVMAGVYGALVLYLAGWFNFY